MLTLRNSTLGAKLYLVATPFLLMALCSIGVLVWMSLHLEGGAASLNEGGRMRMQAYRMLLSASAGDAAALPRQVAEFERSLMLLRKGDPERPLFVPWDETVRRSFKTVEQDWEYFRESLEGAPAPAVQLHPGSNAGVFIAHIDEFVAAIETQLSRWTSRMHLLQITLMALAVVGSAVLLYTVYHFVLEPVSLLTQAFNRTKVGELNARVDYAATDEFGMLASGFNGMAAQLQSMNLSLESRVQEKTTQLEEKHDRLQSLFEVTNLVSRALTLEELASHFARSVARMARADGVALRWVDETNSRNLLLASLGLPARMVEAENWVGDCHCGVLNAPAGVRVIRVREDQPPRMWQYTQAGFETIVAVPIRLQDRPMGELDLYYHAQIEISDAQRSWLEALTVQVAGAIENLRLDALGLEAAVSQERSMLARELHDSIAQSLAFLKIQVQLMRDAIAKGDPQQVDHVLDEIDLGVRESYGDVRELLMNFRTPASAEDIMPALMTTLRKFEHQTGLKATLNMSGQGMPLGRDTQIQVLHIIQEALSNVRKHAHARQVWLDVQQQPRWRLELRDDGTGFSSQEGHVDETHVGLRIMSERAENLGAQFEVRSSMERGTSIVLTLPATFVHDANRRRAA